jgi:hypothetical protein
MLIFALVRQRAKPLDLAPALADALHVTFVRARQGSAAARRAIDPASRA